MRTVEFIIAAGLIAATIALLRVTKWWIDTADYETMESNFGWVSVVVSLFGGVMTTAAIILILEGCFK